MSSWQCSIPWSNAVEDFKRSAWVFEEIRCSGVHCCGPEITNGIAALQIVIRVRGYEYFTGAARLTIERQSAVVEHAVGAGKEVPGIAHPDNVIKDAANSVRQRTLPR